MKKLKWLVITFICIIVIPIKVFAASANVYIGGSHTVVKGNRLTLYVTLSSGTNIGSWQMNLKYDKNYLQLTSANTEAGGTMMAASSATGLKKKTYTFTFKTLKNGNTNISVVNSLAYAYDDLSAMSLSANTKNVRIITQEELEASYSKDNYLKSLSVEGYEINPVFNKETLEYNLTVPEDTKEIELKGQVNDNRSTVSGLGKLALTAGSNSFDIIVRAQNGGERTYKVNVEVKDMNPINVNIDNENLTVVKIKENLPSIHFYQESTIKINDIDIPSYINTNAKITLVGLKNTKGEIKLYVYNEEDNSYKLYNEIGGNGLTIYPLENKDSLKDYEKTIVKLNNTSIPGYAINKDSRQVIIYGMNLATGEKDYYIYDKIDQAIIKYDDEHVVMLREQNRLFSYIIMVFSIILVIMFIVLINISKKKNNKKNNKIIDKPVEKVKEQKKKNNKKKEK